MIELEPKGQKLGGVGRLWGKCFGAAVCLVLTLGCAISQEPSPFPSQSANPKQSSLPKTPHRWQTLPQNWQSQMRVHSFVVAPNNATIFYLGAEGGILQRPSNNLWRFLETDLAHITSLTIHPIDQNQFFISGTWTKDGTAGFLTSLDGGQHWQTLANPTESFRALAIAPSQPTTIYALPSTEEKVFLSSKDGGNTWVRFLPVGLKEIPLRIAVHPKNGDHVFATTPVGLYKSEDGGRNWVLLPDSQNAPIAGLTLTTLVDQSLVIYSYRLIPNAFGLFRSTNGGNTWIPFEKTPKSLTGLIPHLAIAPNNPQILYAVNDQNQVFQSRNAGQDWYLLD